MEKYHIDILRCGRSVLYPKDRRGWRHRFVWLLYVSTEDVSAESLDSPVFRLRFRTRKSAQKAARLCRALLQQGRTHGEVWRWVFDEKTEYLRKDWVNKDYVWDEYAHFKSAFYRFDVLREKWYILRRLKNGSTLGKEVYERVSEAGEDRYAEMCLAALAELGAPFDYVAENGESIAGAARRVGNPYVLAFLGH